MSIEDDDDRLLFLDTDDFAVAVTVTPAGGLARQIVGLFDNGTATTDDGFGGPGTDQPVPTVIARTSDVADLVDDENDTAQIGAVTYKVVGNEPDGSGMTTLLLRKH